MTSTPALIFTKTINSAPSDGAIVWLSPDLAEQTQVVPARYHAAGTHRRKAHFSLLDGEELAGNRHSWAEMDVPTKYADTNPPPSVEK